MFQQGSINQWVNCQLQLYIMTVYVVLFFCFKIDKFLYAICETTKVGHWTEDMDWLLIKLVILEANILYDSCYTLLVKKIL